MLLLVVTLESGRVLHQYMLLSNIAATAVRTGIQLAGLGETCFESTEEGENGEMVPLLLNLGYQATPPAANSLLAHWFAQRRAYVLLYHSRDQILVTGTESPHEPDMSSEFLRNTTDDESESHGCQTVQDAEEPRIESFQNTFAIRLEGTYTPLLFPISLPLRVESRSSYLFQNSNFPLQGGTVCQPKTVGSDDGA